MVLTAEAQVSDQRGRTTRAAPDPPQVWIDTPDGRGRAIAAFVVAFAALTTISYHLSWVSESLRDGWYDRWLFMDFVSHLVCTATAAAVLWIAWKHAPPRGLRRLIVLAISAVLTGVVVGVVRNASAMLLIPGYTSWQSFFPTLWVRVIITTTLNSIFVLVAVELLRIESLENEATHRAELDRSTLERELLQARLQVLRAQVEPHFLFNTLSTVRRLYDTDPTAGRLMFRNLMRYLEVALPHVQSELSRLEDELALVKAFLDIQKVRMGDRLCFSIDFEHALASTMLPTTMILTLVDNAVRHGLAPLRGGGSVEIRAAREGERTLIVTVSDTGRGFGTSDSQGCGTGIANLRARLSALYGDRGSITFSMRQPEGVVATLRVPEEIRPEHRAAPFAAGPAGAR